MGKIVQREIVVNIAESGGFIGVLHEVIEWVGILVRMTVKFAIISGIILTDDVCFFFR